MEIMKITGVDVIPTGITHVTPPKEEEQSNQTQKEQDTARQSTIDTYA